MRQRGTTEANWLEIHNVPHSPGENLNELVCEFGKQIEIYFTSDDTSTTLRIPVAKLNRNKAVAPRIFVKFVRRNAKRQIMLRAPRNE